MIKIHRNTSDKTKVENEHLDGLLDFVLERLELAKIIIANLDGGTIETHVAKVSPSIPKQTKTSFLNSLIGDKTSFTKEEQWGEFNKQNLLKKDVINNKKDILKNLKKINSKKVKNLLIGNVEVIQTTENEIKSANSALNNILSPIYELIFDYDGFASKDNYNAFKLIEYSNIHSCPYCNLNKINQNRIKIKDKVFKEGLRAELDHYFTKSRHPLLALSLYNLIPSCLDCNLRLKGTKIFKLENYLHPYIDEFDEQVGEATSEKIYFEYQLKSGKPDIDVFAPNHEDYFIEIKNDSNLSKKKQRKLYKDASFKDNNGNIHTFQLQESYNSKEAKDRLVTILNFLQKSNNPSYIKSLSWFYNQANDDFLKTYKASLLSVEWSNECYKNANYSKYTKDIVIQYLKELGIKIK